MRRRAKVVAADLADPATIRDVHVVCWTLSLAERFLAAGDIRRGVVLLDAVLHGRGHWPTLQGSQSATAELLFAVRIRLAGLLLQFTVNVQAARKVLQEALSAHAVAMESSAASFVGVTSPNEAAAADPAAGGASATNSRAPSWPNASSAATLHVLMAAALRRLGLFADALGHADAASASLTARVSQAQRCADVATRDGGRNVLLAAAALEKAKVYFEFASPSARGPTRGGGGGGGRGSSSLCGAATAANDSHLDTAGPLGTAAAAGGSAMQDEEEGRWLAAAEDAVTPFTSSFRNRRLVANSSDDHPPPAPPSLYHGRPCGPAMPQVPPSVLVPMAALQYMALLRRRRDVDARRLLQDFTASWTETGPNSSIAAKEGGAPASADNTVLATWALLAAAFELLHPELARASASHASHATAPAASYAPVDDVSVLGERTQSTLTAAMHHDHHHDGAVVPPAVRGGQESGTPGDSIAARMALRRASREPRPPPPPAAGVAAALLTPPRSRGVSNGDDPTPTPTTASRSHRGHKTCPGGMDEDVDWLPPDARRCVFLVIDLCRLVSATSYDEARHTYADFIESCEFLQRNLTAASVDIAPQVVHGRTGLLLALKSCAMQQMINIDLCRLDLTAAVTKLGELTSFLDMYHPHSAMLRADVHIQIAVMALAVGLHEDAIEHLEDAVSWRRRTSTPSSLPSSSEPPPAAEGAAGGRGVTSLSQAARRKRRRGHGEPEPLGGSGGDRFLVDLFSAAREDGDPDLADDDVRLLAAWTLLDYANDRRQTISSHCRSDQNGVVLPPLCAGSNTDGGGSHTPLSSTISAPASVRGRGGSARLPDISTAEQMIDGVLAQRRRRRDGMRTRPLPSELVSAEGRPPPSGDVEDNPTTLRPPREDTSAMMPTPSAGVPLRIESHLELYWEMLVARRLIHRRDYANAIPVLKAAAERGKAWYGVAHATLGTILRLLAVAHRHAGNDDASTLAFQTAAQISMKGKDAVTLFHTLGALAQNMVVVNDADAAKHRQLLDGQRRVAKGFASHLHALGVSGDAASVVSTPRDASTAAATQRLPETLNVVLEWR